MLTAKPRKPLLVPICIALLLYAAGLWITIDFGHLPARHGRTLGGHHDRGDGFHFGTMEYSVKYQ